MGHKGQFWKHKGVSVKLPAREMGACRRGWPGGAQAVVFGYGGVADGEHLKESLPRPRGSSGGCRISEEDPEGLRLGGQEGKVIPRSLRLSPSPHVRFKRLGRGHHKTLSKVLLLQDNQMLFPRTQGKVSKVHHSCSTYVISFP